MIRQLYDYARRLFTLNQQTEKNAADLKELQQEVRELSAALQRLAYEVQRNHDNEQHEREKLILQLENALLRFERLLPPAGSEGDRQKPI